MKNIWIGWIRPLLIIAVVLGTFKSAIADLVYIPTGSMQPTVLEGDRLFVNKLAYGLRIPFTRIALTEWSDPERGNIVLFRSPDGEMRVIKRVIGVPGDVISMRANRLFVNGEPAGYVTADDSVPERVPEDQRGTHAFSLERIDGSGHHIMTSNGKSPYGTFDSITVPEGRFFLMGDNRDNSHDCRAYGFVERNRIIGKVEGVAFSLDPGDYYLPRWNRLVRGLR
jgi:signal peptidase I